MTISVLKIITEDCGSQTVKLSRCFTKSRGDVSCKYEATVTLSTSLTLVQYRCEYSQPMWLLPEVYSRGADP
jgi:hypothetical protein